MIDQSISFQPELFYPLPEISNHKDYAEYRRLLERMDSIILEVGLDLNFASEHISRIVAMRRKKGIDRELTHKQILRLTSYAVKAYRCTLCGILLGKPFRELSILLADSAALQKFCTISRIDNKIKVPTKSTLQRFSEYFDEDFIRSQVDLLNRRAADATNPLRFQDPFTVEEVFVDATCMKANIHFPVDWILMKDCMMTMLQAIIVIRRHGLKHRIKEPKQFISEINALCMSMTSLRRKPGAKKARKNLFRKLKKMAGIIRQHACRYAERLRQEREEKTDLSEAEAACILDRLERMITLLPEAVDQAHCRVIRGAQVANQEKLLSVYHESVNVIKRGKAGDQVEFGNPLFIAEQRDGVIVDWQLYETDVKEVQATRETVERLTEELEYNLQSITGDRGCHSAANDNLLNDKRIFNGLCPRNPLEFAERMQDNAFRNKQKRRAQTEGRIGILKNSILNGSLYERNIEGKKRKVTLAVLTHNLWCLARLPALNEEDRFRHAA